MRTEAHAPGARPGGDRGVAGVRTRFEGYASVVRTEREENVMEPWVWVIIAVAAVLLLLLLFRRGGGGRRVVVRRPARRRRWI